VLSGDRKGSRPEDQRGIAWDFAFTGAAFAALPSASTSFQAQEFSSAVAICLGMKDPHVVAAIVKMGDGHISSRFPLP